jgi:hypothetical protein
MENGRCRMHGGKAGAPWGNRNGLKHGHFAHETRTFRRQTRNLIQETQAILRIAKALPIL